MRIGVLGGRRSWLARFCSQSATTSLQTLGDMLGSSVGRAAPVPVTAGAGNRASNAT
jgi:hypothetical protein